MLKWIIIFLIYPLSLSAQPMLILDSSFREVVLGKYCEYVFSDKNEYCLSQIVNDRSIHFNSQMENLLFLNEDEYKQDIWLKINIKSVFPSSEKFIIELNNPLIDEVQYFKVLNGIAIDSSYSGDAIPFFSRKILFRNPIFQIHFLPGASCIIYFKINANGRKIHLPLTLKTTDMFIEDSQTKNLILGLYYGVLTILTLLYFYLAFALNDRLFLLFAMYMFFLTLALLCTSGLPFQYLWPENPYWNNRSITFFMALTVVAGILFGKEFISNKYLTKKVNALIYGLTGFAFIVGLIALGNSTFLNYSMYILYRLIPVIYFMLLLLGGYFLMKKFKSARFFTIAFFSAMIGVGSMILYSTGYEANNAFTNNFAIFAILIKCFLLSIAMLDHLVILKKEKELAQAMVIGQLEDLNLFKERINLELESKVLQKSKELSEKQNEIKRALIYGEEKERKRIAQELHDGMGSLLSTLKLNAESICISDRNFSKKEILVFQNVLSMIDLACNELRNISHNIIPGDLEYYGLTATLKSLVNRVNLNSTTGFELNVLNIEVIFNKETELSIYRIILELINNIIKHANAKTAYIQLIKQDGYVSLIVEDDGIGFQSPQIDITGTGLLNIYSRIEALGGKINIDSIKKKGTTVILEIPY